MHKPVLLKETIHYLDPKEGETIIDTTVNGGGHAREILKAMNWKGRVVGIDQDAEVLEKLASEVKERGWEKNIILINGNFRDLDRLLAHYKIKEADGILFDLGMSSNQLELSGRGFSFQRNEPLVMTFKSSIAPSDLTARDIVNKWSEKDIAEILRKYGEERFAGRIARGIVEARQRREIRTTFDLVEIVARSVPASYRRNPYRHFCTKTFQALRIAVNDELAAFEEGLKKAWEHLKPGGRAVVISFHSLEDRIAKNFFREKRNEGEAEILTRKPLEPSEEEKNLNPRARSAKLRAAKKI